jgi:hypothetical protein
MAFRTIPEYILEDIVDYVLFALRFVACLSHIRVRINQISTQAHPRKLRSIWQERTGRVRPYLPDIDLVHKESVS